MKYENNYLKKKNLVLKRDLVLLFELDESQLDWQKNR